MEAIDIISIVLSLVALIVTVIGFFASLKFYQSGVEQQKITSETLSAVQEISRSIKTQVDGMFNKTLDAAIGRTSEDFEVLDEQLEATSEAIVEAAVQQIGAAGEAERQKLKEVVEQNIGQVKQRVEETRESAEEIVEAVGHRLPQSRFQAQVIAFLHASGKSKRSKITSELGRDKSSVQRVLQKLTDRNFLIQEGESFSLSAKGKKIAKHAIGTNT
jgi:uncharacterized protein YicC (UPF0701 family)